MFFVTRLVLYSEPYFNGTINIINDVKSKVILIEPSIKVYSFVNLKNQFYILSQFKVSTNQFVLGNEKLKTLNIYIEPMSSDSNLRTKYREHNMDSVKKVNFNQFYLSKKNNPNILQNEQSAPIEPIEPVEQNESIGENVNIDTNPEQKKKQSTDTLPWYSIITIIIFIILILLCIVYRESLRSLSNLATLDPRKLRDTLNPF